MREKVSATDRDLKMPMKALLDEGMEVGQGTVTDAGFSSGSKLSLTDPCWLMS